MCVSFTSEAAVAYRKLLEARRKGEDVDFDKVYAIENRYFEARYMGDDEAQADAALDLRILADQLG